jgi:hypothetical protein
LQPRTGARIGQCARSGRRAKACIGGDIVASRNVDAARAPPAIVASDMVRAAVDSTADANVGARLARLILKVAEPLRRQNRQAIELNLARIVVQGRIELSLAGLRPRWASVKGRADNRLTGAIKIDSIRRSSAR